jgi:thiamine-phosphate pyrophosphorylase
MKLPEPPLLLITDRKQARLPLVEIARASFSAGCRWISIREKDLPRAEFSALACEGLLVAKSYNAVISIHGEAAQAKNLSTGLHLASGSDPGAARKLLGGDKVIGLSVHSTEEAARADPRVVDYVIAGAVFETASKPGYPPLGLNGLKAIAEASKVPVIAIGGIGARNCGSVIRAGATGIAVMGTIMRAADPGREMRALIAALRAAG